MTDPLIAYYNPMFSPHFFNGEKLLYASNCNSDNWLKSHGRESKEGALGLTNFRVIYKAYSGACTRSIDWAGIKSVSKNWIAIPFSTLLVLNLHSGKKNDFLVSKKNYKFLNQFFEMAITTWTNAEYPEGFDFNKSWTVA